MIKLGDLVEKILYITGINTYGKKKYKGGPCDECKKKKKKIFK